MQPTNSLVDKSYRENLLANPSLGIAKLPSDETNVYDFMLLKWEKVNLNNILTSIITEAIANSLDNYYRSSESERNLFRLAVSYKDGIFSIFNTGKPVDLSLITNFSNMTPSMIKNFKYKIETAFGKKGTSSNFTKSSTTTGIHGWGAFIINVFSSVLKVNVYSPEKIYNLMYKGTQYKRTIVNNDSRMKNGINVIFKPNWEYLKIDINEIGFYNELTSFLTMTCRDILDNCNINITLKIDGDNIALRDLDYQSVEYSEKLAYPVPIKLRDFSDVSLKIFPSKYKTHEENSRNPYNNSIFVNGHRYERATIVQNIYRSLYNTILKEYPDCKINYVKKNITIIFSGLIRDFGVNNQSKTDLRTASDSSLFKIDLIKDLDKEFKDWTFLRGLKKAVSKSTKTAKTKLIEASDEENCTLYITDSFQRVEYLSSKFGNKNVGYFYEGKPKNIPQKYINFVIDIRKGIIDTKFIRNAMEDIEDCVSSIENLPIDLYLEKFNKNKLMVNNTGMNRNLLRLVSPGNYVNKDTMNIIQKGFVGNLTNDILGMFERVNKTLYKVNPIVSKLIIDGISLLPVNFLLGPSTYNPNTLIDILINPDSYSKDSLVLNYYPGYCGNVLVNIDVDGYSITKIIPKVRISKFEIIDCQNVYKKIIISNIPPTIDRESLINKYPDGVFEYKNGKLSSITLNNYKTLKEVSYNNLGISTKFDSFDYTSTTGSYQTFKSIMDYTRELNLNRYSLEEYTAKLNLLRIKEEPTLYTPIVKSSQPRIMEEVPIENYTPVHDNMMKLLINL